MFGICEATALVKPCQSLDWSAITAHAAPANDSQREMETACDSLVSGWPQDNLLAVATARTVVILSAGQLDGPRAVVDVPHPDPVGASHWDDISIRQARHPRLASTIAIIQAIITRGRSLYM